MTISIMIFTYPGIMHMITIKTAMNYDVKETRLSAEIQ